jgi:hypothetical protein
MHLLHTFKRSRANFPGQNQLMILRGQIIFSISSSRKNWAGGGQNFLMKSVFKLGGKTFFAFQAPEKNWAGGGQNFFVETRISIREQKKLLYMVIGGGWWIMTLFFFFLLTSYRLISPLHFSNSIKCML